MEEKKKEEKVEVKEIKKVENQNALKRSYSIYTILYYIISIYCILYTISSFTSSLPDSYKTKIENIF